MPTYASHLRRRWKKVLLFGVVGLFLITAFSVFFLPFEFKAETQIFILPRDLSDTDSYTSVKSSERLGENLSRLILTSSFFDLVANAGVGQIDLNVFPQEPKKRLRKWKRMVESFQVPGTGLMRLSVYHVSREQARVIAQTVADVLTFRGRDYTGFDVDIKQVDAVLVSRLPARPSLPLNALLGFVLGALIGALYIVFEEERAVSL
jgi:capsular polysaccharide biosynthesis protein